MKALGRLGIVSVIAASLLLAGYGGGPVSAQGTAYEEYVVTLDNDIQGTIVQPTVEGKVPVVVMLHGFASTRDEVGEMYKRLAAALGERGIGSLRIDFRGWGESGGEMVESSITGQVEDATTAYNYLTTLEFVDTERIGLIGFSLGGSIAVFSAGEHPGWYHSMALWSASRDVHSAFVEELGQENFDKAAAEGQVTIDLGWREVTLGAEFFTSLTAYDAEVLFPQYQGAFLVVAGSEDASADSLDWYLTQAQGQLRAAFLVDGADHIYGVLSDDQALADTVILATADWFTMTLR